MRKIFVLFALFALLMPASAMAQDANAEELQKLSNVECMQCVSSPWRSNWFLQLGAGINMPFVENSMEGIDGAEAKHHASLGFNLGVGHWISPYLAFRFNALGGKIKWDSFYNASAKYANLNFDLMWDMFNSLGGINTKRVFSIYPFVGIGAAYTWDIDGKSTNIRNNDGTIKTNSWTVPASLGLKFNFRLSKYVDLYLEGRAMFAADNFNGCEYDNPFDIIGTAMAGLTFNFGGRNFDYVNPCDYLDYINNLNNRINGLRGEIASTAAALAACEAQLPCPEAKPVDCPEPTQAFVATVQFSLNSAKIGSREKTHIYNVAEWMKANPDAKLVINGYADKKTGTSPYNEKLSERRANAVKKQLVEYGVDEDRLAIDAHSDAVKPYSENSWNRVVVFSIK